MSSNKQNKKARKQNLCKFWGVCMWKYEEEEEEEEEIAKLQVPINCPKNMYTVTQ
jgi:hypothetical protein